MSEYGVVTLSRCQRSKLRWAFRWASGAIPPDPL